MQKDSAGVSSLETILKPFDLHVLVCTNTRIASGGFNTDGTPSPPAKQSCGPLGAEDIRAELKAWLFSEIRNRPALNGRIKTRVNGSGCLDFCKKGIVIAIYPQSEFTFFVKNTTASIAQVKANLLLKLDELENRL